MKSFVKVLMFSFILCVNSLYSMNHLGSALQAADSSEPGQIDDLVSFCDRNSGLVTYCEPNTMQIVFIFNSVTNQFVLWRDQRRNYLYFPVQPQEPLYQQTVVEQSSFFSRVKQRIASFFGLSSSAQQSAVTLVELPDNSSQNMLNNSEADVEKNQDTTTKNNTITTSQNSQNDDLQNIVPAEKDSNNEQALVTPYNMQSQEKPEDTDQLVKIDAQDSGFVQTQVLDDAQKDEELKTQLKVLKAEITALKNQSHRQGVKRQRIEEEDVKPTETCKIRKTNHAKNPKEESTKFIVKKRPIVATLDGLQMQGHPDCDLCKIPFKVQDLVVHCSRDHCPSLSDKTPNFVVYHKDCIETIAKVMDEEICFVCENNHKMQRAPDLVFLSQ